MTKTTNIICRLSETDGVKDTDILSNAYFLLMELCQDLGYKRELDVDVYNYDCGRMEHYVYAEEELYALAEILRNLVDAERIEIMTTED